MNTTQRGKVLSHSLNLVKSRHFVAGEELRGAFEEVRCELEDARHCYWVADGDSLTDPAEAPARLAEPDAPRPGAARKQSDGDRSGTPQGPLFLHLHIGHHGPAQGLHP
ncbi:long-chain-acyl-CoA synthetase [compost metagenome]